MTTRSLPASMSAIGPENRMLRRCRRTSTGTNRCATGHEHLLDIQHQHRHDHYGGVSSATSPQAAPGVRLHRQAHRDNSERRTMLRCIINCPLGQCSAHRI